MPSIYNEELIICNNWVNIVQTMHTVSILCEEVPQIVPFRTIDGYYFSGNVFQDLSGCLVQHLPAFWMTFASIVYNLYFMEYVYVWFKIYIVCSKHVWFTSYMGEMNV